MQVVDTHGRGIEAKNVNANTHNKVWRAVQAGNLLRKDHTG